MSHRLFVGLRPPASHRDQLIDRMQGVDEARWQDDEQLHLTLRYIGDVETHQADDLAEQLGSIDFQPFDLTVSSTGFFERKGHLRALWAGVEQSEALIRLQRKVERMCQAVGFEAEGRKFLPHITLARLNSASGPANAFLSATSTLRLEPWTVQEFVLYESELHPEGSIYTPIVRYPARKCT
ncbi:RNA 2',3'-cyclic phosphodiesterase [Erythrobacter aquimaris]|uniref:RNA 2',3'-cyclic phosphodiesterase n=1 Tax=Qipengyuania aquimaris TaxID=255984 RepID=A0A6I4TLE6_9SPHN|nr:RNA 2',3'-cyclic phosphodiesterase [Qipengyuania aquimaris]MXO95907.1 RNA 2',3'-cyclic phosphodiesterase [Qipengyuania aquimaris]